ncbi:hypothetical protein V5799_027954 [Amblyomma americanum]|uniref:Uncharacterized protein n=1 Tax=Amblyomma americanum TaxID=6943 RepID=A0AAQ4DE89_AMBAM
MPTSKRSRTSKFLHPYHGPFRLVRQTAENDWEVENRRGRRDIVNVNRIKPYVDLEDNAATSPEERNSEECATISAQRMQRSHAQKRAQMSSHLVTVTRFFDASDTVPCDNAITTSERTRRHIVPPRRDDFVYY